MGAQPSQAWCILPSPRATIERGLPANGSPRIAVRVIARSCRWLGLAFVPRSPEPGRSVRPNGALGIRAGDQDLRRRHVRAGGGRDRPVRLHRVGRAVEEILCRHVLPAAGVDSAPFGKVGDPGDPGGRAAEWPTIDFRRASAELAPCSTSEDDLRPFHCVRSLRGRPALR